MDRYEIKIGVRELVSFICRSGDLDNRFTISARGQEGTRAHQKIQKARKTENYKAEIFLRKKIEYDNFDVIVEGRADGVFECEDGIVLEEIKTTLLPLADIDENYNPVHWAQAKIYAYLYILEQELNEIQVRLLYFHLEKEEEKAFTQHYTRNELKIFFEEIIDKYYWWARKKINHLEERNNSLKELSFPFPGYRKGQRKMAVAVYKSIAQEKNLFAQAPTGIGKTISTIFPSLKALGEGEGEQVFYLTAKNETKQVAKDNLRLILQKQISLKVLIITAKEKICLMEETDCNPQYCPYARGHFDRVNIPLKEIMREENLITREILLDYAEKYKVCPFELSLDLILWFDFIICDYNYIFDPRVGLKRVVNGQMEGTILLIDEAHNLVRRGREMYSASLSDVDFLLVDKYLTGSEEGKYLVEINDIFKKMSGNFKDNKYVTEEEPQELYPLLRGVCAKLEEELIYKEYKKEEYEVLLETYFKLLNFLKIAEFFDGGYRCYWQKEDKEMTVKLFCLDPAQRLKEVINKGKTGIFFSATLTPLGYYRELLGGDDNDFCLKLPSPFPEENLGLFVINRLSTRYTERASGYDELVEYIIQLTQAKKGNYFVFFPSYEYLQAIEEKFISRLSSYKLIVQRPAMDYQEREKFLKNFVLKNEKHDGVIGFAVMGGIFSEGINLEGDHLVGTIVVGVGHPPISIERELIREYYQKKAGKGYEYAYIYPGMNKVLQAAGRTIRSEDDKGVVLLIGERFLSYPYINLLKENYRNYISISSKDVMESFLQNFWYKK